MSLTVLNVAFPFVPVNDDPIGGAEQIVAQLDRMLVSKGHRSIVIAVDGSRTAGHLLPLPRVANAVDNRAWRLAHDLVRESIATVLTDYCDGLFAPGHDDEAGHMLEMLGAIAERESMRVDLQQLRASSPLLLARTPAGWLEEMHAGPECPVTQLSGSAGLDGISRERLKKLGRLQRHLQNEDGYVLGPGNDEDTGNAAETLERLHTCRWERRGGRGVLADALMRAFMRTVIPDLNAAGLLRITQLKVQNRAIAIVFAIQSRRAAYSYLGGFDPEWSRASPGALTIVAAMKQAAAEGADEFHFLRGSEAYKYHLGAQDRPTYRRVLSRSQVPCA